MMTLYLMGLVHTPGYDGIPFGNNYFTEMCSGYEAGSYLRLTDFVYHSTLGLRVIKKKKGSWLDINQKSVRISAGTAYFLTVLPAAGHARV